MTRSRTSSISSQTLGLFSSHVIDYQSPFSPSTSQDDNVSSFHETLNTFRTTQERDALVSALQETAAECSTRMATDGVSPNELFVTLLSALNSLTSFLEEKLKSDESDGRGEKEVQTIISLLELLRRVSQFVVHWGNNHGALFAHQFPVISRNLRLLTALSASISSESTNNQPGSGALCRQLLKTCTTILLLAPSSIPEKGIMQLLDVLYRMVNDSRPKIRKCAWGCFVEICMVTHETGQSLENNYDMTDVEIIKTAKQRRVLANKIWSFCHTVLIAKTNKQNDTKSINVLRFLENALSYAGDDTRVKFGEVCLTLIGGAPSVEVIHQSLMTLLSCMESAQETADERDNEEMVKFVSRALAFLLQQRPNAESTNLFVVYARCLTGCVKYMIGRGNMTSTLLAFKLLSNVIKSILHLCEGDNAESCAAEFNQLLSYVSPNIMSSVKDDENQLNRVAKETISQCVPVLETALHIQYRNEWDSILPGGYATFATALAASLLGEGGNLESYVKSMVLTLLRLKQDVENDSAATTAVEYATSTIIKGMGLEVFLSIVDFVEDDGEQSKSLSFSTTGGGIRDDRAWLLPLLKQSVPLFSSELTLNMPVFTETSKTKSHLSFFQGRVLNLARRCDAASVDEHRTPAEAAIQHARVIELWAVLPAFCQHPVDMKENFAAFAKTLVKALGDYTRYPKLIPIICGSLKTLTIGILLRSESQKSPESEQDFEVLSNVSTKILPSLFKLVENLIQTPTSNAAFIDNMDEDTASLSKRKHQVSNQQNMQFVESVIDVIGFLARVCPRDFLQNLFKKVVQKLLVASTEESESVHSRFEKEGNNLRMCSLLGLAKSLVSSGSLDEASLSLLFRAIRPFVRSDEYDPRVQKRAYKVLVKICECHKDFVTSSERLDDLMNLMVESIVTSQVSARHMRLKCMTLIISGFDSSIEAHMAIIPKVMGEVLLCLKDSNAKTRDASYKLLLAMAVARDDITEFFKIILAALGAQTSHMRSAAVMALSRLIYEYARDDEAVQELIPHLMQTVAVLFDDPAREVNKSVIGFVRVAVAAMTKERLEPLLPLIIGGIMKYNRGKDRFRQKIKIILKKLVRVYGYDTIAPLVPEKDARLMSHMRKLAERAARRKAAGLQDGQTMAGDDFNNMMESDEDDSDDGRTFMTGVTGFTKMTSMTGKTTKRSIKDRSVKSHGKSVMTSNSTAGDGPQIKAEVRGEVLDLLDSSKMARSVRFVDMNKHDVSDDDSDEYDHMHVDNLGRIVISEGLPTMQEEKASENYESDDEENLELKTGSKRRRVSKLESVKLARAEKDAVKSKKAKNKQQQTLSLGAAYKSKKAGGDTMKKNQKYEPYAYVPLNAKDYTKKNRGRAVSKMGTVVYSNKRKRT